MYSNTVKCLYQDDSLELIINNKNKQVLLLERSFSECVRSSNDFFDLRQICRIDNNDAGNFENTFQYLVSNGFIDSVYHENFEKKFYQWQDYTKNLTTNISNIETLCRCILNEGLLVSKLTIVIGKSFKLENQKRKIKEKIREIRKHIGELNFIINADKSQLCEQFEIVDALYNLVDEFVVCISETIEPSSFCELIENDNNKKINFQIYIKEYLEYRSIFEYFFSLKKKIIHSSKVYCYLFSFEGDQHYDANEIVCLLNNNISCLSSISQIDGEMQCDVVPYTINDYSIDLLFVGDEFLQENRIKKCNQKCCYADFCPYTSNEKFCHYKKMLTETLGIVVDN